MGTTQSIRTAVIGAGPRGTSVLERLLANWAPAGSDQTLHIDVIDPYPAGPGHVWQPGQSRLYLMNTQSFYPTIVPQDKELARPVAGYTFDQWREIQRRHPDAALTAEERDELARLSAADFPSRALYGRYLRSTLEQLLSRLPAGVTVDFHPAAATSVRPTTAPAIPGGAGVAGDLPTAGSGAIASGAGAGAGTGVKAGFDVGLDDGTQLTVDSVVLALGHLEARLSAEQHKLQAAAAELGLIYLPPAAPADVDWTRIPAGKPVLVRGMGLNFFDVMGQLTEGRGGRFVAGDDGGLSYLPSGREPLILAASRRGTPYRTKATLSGYYPAAVSLRYLTERAIAKFAEIGIRPSFDHDLWPLLHRDAVWAYYSTLARSQPEAIVTGPEEFLQALDDAMHPHAHSTVRWEDTADPVLDVHVRPGFRLDLLGLAAPLAGRSFGSRDELDAAVAAYLVDDARRSALGEDDPVKMAIGALHHGRAVLKTAVADRGITDESWVAGLRGWFESFVEGLASGPPALRAEQLAALVRAGVVRFVGPDPKFTVDRAAGMFTAASPWVGSGPGDGTQGSAVAGEVLAAACMIEALAPSNRVAVNASPLLAQLLAEGWVRPRLMMTVEGAPVETSGLDVALHPYRPLAANGSVTEGLYVLGLQLSSTQWGTAIAAESRQKSGPVYRSGQRTLHDADEIARHILGR